MTGVQSVGFSFANWRVRESRWTDERLPTRLPPMEAANEHAGGESIRRSGCPGLPGVDDRGCEGVWPDQVEARRGWCRERVEDQGRDHAEIAAASTA